jgi:polyferredoxin
LLCHGRGPAEGIGLETDGCPLYSHPNSLTDNRNCVACMTCVKACPTTSVGFFLRPPAYDIASGKHEGSLWEVMLLFLLLGNVFMRRLPELSALLHQDLLSTFPVHAVSTVFTLAAPLVVAGVVTQLWQRPVLEAAESGRPGAGGKTLDFVTLSYGW